MALWHLGFTPSLGALQEFRRRHGLGALGASAANDPAVLYAALKVKQEKAALDVLQKRITLARKSRSAGKLIPLVLVELQKYSKSPQDMEQKLAAARAKLPAGADDIEVLTLVVEMLAVETAAGERAIKDVAAGLLPREALTPGYWMSHFQPALVAGGSWQAAREAKAQVAAVRLERSKKEDEQARDMLAGNRSRYLQTALVTGWKSKDVRAALKYVPARNEEVLPEQVTRGWLLVEALAYFFAASSALGTQLAQPELGELSTPREVELFVAKQLRAARVPILAPDGLTRGVFSVVPGAEALDEEDPKVEGKIKRILTEMRKESRVPLTTIAMAAYPERAGAMQRALIEAFEANPDLSESQEKAIRQKKWEEEDQLVQYNERQRLTNVALVERLFTLPPAPVASKSPAKREAQTMQYARRVVRWMRDVTYILLTWLIHGAPLAFKEIRDRSRQRSFAEKDAGLGLLSDVVMEILQQEPMGHTEWFPYDGPRWLSGERTSRHNFVYGGEVKFLRPQTSQEFSKAPAVLVEEQETRQPLSINHGSFMRTFFQVYAEGSEKFVKDGAQRLQTALRYQVKFTLAVLARQLRFIKSRGSTEFEKAEAANLPGASLEEQQAGEVRLIASSSFREFQDATPEVLLLSEQLQESRLTADSDERLRLSADAVNAWLPQLQARMGAAFSVGAFGESDLERLERSAQRSLIEEGTRDVVLQVNAHLQNIHEKLKASASTVKAGAAATAADEAVRAAGGSGPLAALARLRSDESMANALWRTEVLRETSALYIKETSDDAAYRFMQRMKSPTRKEAEQTLFGKDVSRLTGVLFSALKSAGALEELKPKEYTGYQTENAAELQRLYRRDLKKRTEERGFVVAPSDLPEMELVKYRRRLWDTKGKERDLLVELEKCAVATSEFRLNQTSDAAVRTHAEYVGYFTTEEPMHRLILLHYRQKAFEVIASSGDRGGVARLALTMNLFLSQPRVRAIRGKESEETKYALAEAIYRSDQELKNKKQSGYQGYELPREMQPPKDKDGKPIPETLKQEAERRKRGLNSLVSTMSQRQALANQVVYQVNLALHLWQKYGLVPFDMLGSIFTKELKAELSAIWKAVPTASREKAIKLLGQLEQHEKGIERIVAAMEKLQELLKAALEQESNPVSAELLRGYALPALTAGQASFHAESDSVRKNLAMFIKSTRESLFPEGG